MNNNVVTLPTNFVPKMPTDADFREHLIIQSQMIATLSEEITELSKTIFKLVRVLKDKA